MLYRSEKLRKDFRTEKECLEAEEKYDALVVAEKEKKEKLAKERAERAKEVEAAYNLVLEDKKKYNELLNKFIKDYGTFHMSISSDRGFFDAYDKFFKNFF